MSQTFFRISFVLLLAGAAHAQMGQVQSISVPWSFSSGLVVNENATQTETLWLQTISVSWTGALQVQFAEVQLMSQDDAVVVRSVADGQTQVLTANELERWQQRSAFFNGSAVDVGLRLSPGSAGVVEVIEVRAFAPPASVDDLCGNDDRNPTADSRVCRLVITNSGGLGVCTGFLVNGESVALSAGHCFNSPTPSAVTAQFNVPASTAAGGIVFPAIADQYPVDLSAVLSENGGGGRDWAAFRLHPNSFGQLASNNQGSMPCGVVGPAIGIGQLRVTGYGTDNTPDNTRNFVQQDCTGTYMGFSGPGGDQLNHQVDTTGGNSGSPIIFTNTGVCMGIHTNGGCNPPFFSNFGTAFTYATVLNAANSIGGCGHFTPANNAPVTVSCTPRIFNLTPAGAEWNVVAVGSSASDWDVTIEGVSSTFGGTTVDFLIANGHLGTVAPVSGTASRFSGSTDGVVEVESATTMTVGSQLYMAWSSNEVVKLVQFNVPSAGNYDVTLNGDPSLFWDLYTPGSNQGWRPRGAPFFGPVGGGPAIGLSLGTGWHCLVIVRDAGPASVPTPALTVTVSPSVSPVALSQNIPATIANSSQPFSMSPVGGRWNIVGVGSTSDWDTDVGPAQSQFGGSYTDFALANGHFGTIAPAGGVFFRYSGAASATALHVAAQTFAPGQTVDTALGANQLFALHEFNVTAAGNYDITVSGDSSLGWDAYTPGSSSSWRARGAPFYGQVGGGTHAGISLGTGWHAIVIIKDGGAAAAYLPYTVNVCPSAPPIAVNISPVAVTNSCQPFTTSPTAGVWNAVGVTSASDWDISMGAVEAQSGGGVCDFVIANGHNGALSPTSGLIARYSGATTATAQRYSGATVVVGGQIAATWTASDVIKVVEFNVSIAGNYTISLTGSTFLGWRLYKPGTTSAWTTRALADLTGTVGSLPVTGYALQPGWHALAIYKDNGTGTAGTVSATVILPNPVPVLTTINPVFVTGGGPAFTLTLNGSGFVGASVARWAGSNLATTFVSATQLTATVPAALIAGPGTAAIDVFTPAPGGGTSAPQTITVNNPVPAIASLNPPSMLVNSPTFTITINGTGFNSTSTATWTAVTTTNLTTTYVSPTQLTAIVPASLLTLATIRSVGVFNPAPGGGIASLNFPINNPAPVLVSVSPNLFFTGGSSTTMTLNGSNFVSGSYARWNFGIMTTTYVSATQLTAAVPSGLLASPGTAIVHVVTNGPGGGVSADRTVTITNPAPTLASMGPTSAAAGSPGFLMAVSGTGYLPSTVVRWNGTNLATTYISSAFSLLASVPASFIASPGTANVTVFNPGPGGGTSAPLVFNVGAPQITTLLPQSIAIMTAASPPVTVTITGTLFVPSSTAYANGKALATTFVDTAHLTCMVGPSVEQTRLLGGIAIAVRTYPGIVSNTVALTVGAGNNQGTIGHVPLAEPLVPGSTFALVLEGGLPLAAFTMVIDTGNPAPIGAFPNPAANLVLSVGSAGMTPLLDGLGLFGAPMPGVAFGANASGNTPPGGTFVLPGITASNPPLGVTVTLQAGYLDPTSPAGFRLTWARLTDI